MLFEKEEYSPAIRLYNEAIKRYNTSPVLYGNRAAAYMKRDWLVADHSYFLYIIIGLLKRMFTKIDFIS